MGRILLAVTLVASALCVVPGVAHAKSDKTLYIVQLAGGPAGRQESARAPIRTNRAAVLRAAGIATTVAEYETVFNGFAAALTPAQKTRVERTPGVRRLWKNERRTVDTISTPAFLGLSGADGAWSKKFGNPAHAGEGVIIGVIYTGFWPERPSLAALPEPRPDQAVVDQKWTGGPIQRAGAAAGPLDYGAGHVRPQYAFDPGLVYDAGAQDWARYTCGIGQLQLVSDWCPIVGTIDPSDLNYPSIGIGSLPGAQTVTRTVTNVGKQPSVYVASVSPPPGTRVTVTPSTIGIGPGESVTFKVSIVRTDAAYGIGRSAP